MSNTSRATLIERSITRLASVQVREALQSVSQCAAEGSEVGSETAPISDARSVERLTHLFGARSAHGALGPVKVHTGGLELESAMVQQAANGNLRIADQ